MVKKEPSTGKGEQTRSDIFENALALFREGGFDNTTMQQIADRAQVAKGAAYYYFPSKEALIQAYYDKLQTGQEELCAQTFARTKSLKQRLSSAMHVKFDLVQNDRGLLAVVFRYTGEPNHPLSCLGKGTESIRRRSIQIFRDAIAEEGLPNDLQELLPIALWSLQMGLLIMFLYDESSNQQRTRNLADGAIALTLKFLLLAKLPILKPVRTRVLALLRAADLLPSA